MECSDIEALINRIGFWGPVYHSYNKDPPPQKKKSIGTYSGAYTKSLIIALIDRFEGTLFQSAIVKAPHIIPQTVVPMRPRRKTLNPKPLDPKP